MNGFIGSVHTVSGMCSQIIESFTVSVVPVFNCFDFFSRHLAGEESVLHGESAGEAEAAAE